MDGMVWLCDIAVAEGDMHHFARLVQILLMNTITSKIRVLAIPLLLSAGKLRRTDIFCQLKTVRSRYITVKKTQSHTEY
jgi:hypothetical protein